ncbi:hypothetical protein GOBAR_AA22368 [Gossypium barbadense]|uniref:Uncharacterized protein n=1 Tax=Gossypium barbadense TaxID=3634 RepID=A0A2P5X4N9_GOSBA|nr:hypothetical protein GOBAR_AA22368 [Gossypium barbadense]
MSVFGEAVLSAFLELLSAKLLDSILNFLADYGQVHQQLKLWQSILPEIKAVLNHAEEKQIKDEDEEAITDRLNSLNTRRNSLGLSEIMSQGATSKGKKPRLQPTSLIDGAVEYVGRANEKQKMLELLKSNNFDGVCVLSIVGMGGIGKTTLAQLVYNDPSIKESFYHKSWVCVSDDFDAVNITKTILRSLDADSRDENDLNLLQVMLKEKLSGKRFLLVLDDIWNESYRDWTILRRPFGAGTKIIHALKARNFDGHPQFKEIGENIVRRCNGLPLAAEAIGSLLRTVTDHSEWEKRCFAYCSIFPKDYEFKEEEIILLWRAEGFLQLKAKIQGKGLGNQYFQDLVSRLEGEKQQKFSRRSRHSAHTLILRDCSKLKNLPSKIGNLVNLHFLDIRGEGDGLLIRELKNLSNLRGNFCLSGLENVNGQDAREAKLNEKLGIDGLELQWGTGLENSTRKKEVEERVLDFLRPQKKLEQLIIENYGGVKFSSWIADSSFKNLSSLKLRNCKNCKSLPSVGRFPLLKDLSIISFDQVQKIGVKLFGENQLNPFASLEILSFESPPNWKEWDTCEGDEKVLKLPRLRELSIKTCPQLLGRLPTHLPSLQKLEIHSCTRLVVSISSFPSLCKFSIRGCAELVDDCSSPAKELSSLQTLSLSNISKFNIPADRIMLRFGNSEHFEIDAWEELASLSQHGFSLVGHRFISVWHCPQLQSLEAEEAELQPNKISHVESLKIASCGRLNRLPQVLHELTFLTVIEIYNCRGLVSFAENNLPPNLKKLKIADCENLEYLVDEKEDNKSMSSILCLLEDLEIFECPSLMSLSSKGHKNICNQLQFLEISACSKLSCLFSNTMFPITLKHLTIRGCPELEYIAQEFEETACLESIVIFRSGIKSLPRGLDKLIHLQEICLGSCSNLVPFEESGLLTTSFRAFLVDRCGKFGTLPKCMASITSLRELRVCNCLADISFPSERFPVNLTSLAISNAPKIYRSLVEWGLNRLTSLQKLAIGGGGCSNVVSFPEEGIGIMLPPSLTRISLSEFENLEFMFSEGFQDLASLKELVIDNCPQLTSLPK